MDNLNTKINDYNITYIIKIIIWLKYAFKIHIFNANILIGNNVYLLKELKQLEIKKI